MPLNYIIGLRLTFSLEESNGILELSYSLVNGINNIYSLQSMDWGERDDWVSGLYANDLMVSGMQLERAGC